MGNSVILLCNQDSCTAASYFNMFSTAEIPPGIINLLLNKQICECFHSIFQELDSFIFEHCTSRNYIILPLK